MATTTLTQAAPVKEVHAKLNHHLEVENGGSETFLLGTGSDMVRNKHDVVETVIENIRGHEADFKLDEQGFQLLQGVNPIKTSESDWVKANHYEHVAEKIRAYSGASEILVVSHNVRPNRPKDDRSMPMEYAQRVHVDYSFTGAYDTFTAKCPQYAEKFDKVRWAVINWWQPFDVPVTRMALAMCDARTVPEQDWREVTTLRAHQKSYKLSEYYQKLPDFGSWKLARPQVPGTHKWYFAHEMQLDEALMIKIFDSKEHGVSRRVPHSAFQSPLDHGPERKSIEFRCVAIWDDEPVRGRTA
ncbi:hypothetical protein CERZMDRAFT_45829 [Cercospora zeae-maydis SCOH1-5]|uniref:Methyltransferase n=1 Tax=Cercospora zeae-maydis SCOH1-5 TaxID=717836 RepID=A0A6A6F9U0_9PEZI|nr:hypothetical protein CERZMDRAFT_45829 [Cercospora zeae-maydis SCOH1-5]